MEKIVQWLRAIWSWLLLNREWLFSGIGVTAITLVGSIVVIAHGRRRDAKRASETPPPTPEEPVETGTPSRLITQLSDEERIKHNPELRALMEAVKGISKFEKSLKYCERKRGVANPSTLLLIALLLLLAGLLFSCMPGR